MALPTGGPFTTLDVMNNKFPCEGPECVPLYLDFTAANNYQIDLKSLVQGGKISMIQSLYIDNADGTQPVTFVQSITNQRIIIPAGAQAYLNGLFSGAQFTATSGSLAIVKVFAQNFPVTNCVWNTGSAGAPSQNVSVLNFPASQTVSLDRGQSQAFKPGDTTPGTNVAVTTSSQNVAIFAALGSNVLLTNSGAGIIHVRLGPSAQTALVSDLPIMPGQRIIISTNGYGNLGVIGEAVSTLNIVAGSGGI